MKSSQPLFQNGYLEHNQFLTVDGRPNSTPVDEKTGDRIILKQALSNLGASALNNTGERWLEGIAVKRYPSHSKLIHALGWVERSAFAALFSYYVSDAHYRQWRTNQRMASQLGIP